MRPWASWTAKTAVFSLAAGLAATAPASAPAQGGQAGQSAAGTGRGEASQGASQGSGQGSGRASSQGTSGQGAARGSGQGAARNSSQGLAATVGQVIERAVAPVTAVLGAGGSGPALGTAPAPLTAVTGDPSSRDTGADDASASGTDRTSANPPARAGDTNVPATTQLAGLGALPGLADLPSAGPASTPSAMGHRAAAFPCPGPRCRRPVRV